MINQREQMGFKYDWYISPVNSNRSNWELSNVSNNSCEKKEQTNDSHTIFVYANYTCLVSVNSVPLFRRTAIFKDQWHGYTDRIYQDYHPKVDRDTRESRGEPLLISAGAVADGHKSHSPGAKTTKEIPGLLRSLTIRVLQNATARRSKH